VLPKDTLSSPSGGYIPSEGMCPLASPSAEIPRRAAYEFLSSASKGKHRLARCRPLPPPPPLRLPPQNHLACLDHLARPRVHGHPRARAILRAFIDHCVPAGVNPEPYLVSWLADSRIFPIPFHQAGVKGRL